MSFENLISDLKKLHDSHKYKYNTLQTFPIDIILEKSNSDQFFILYEELLKINTLKLDSSYSKIFDNSLYLSEISNILCYLCEILTTFNICSLKIFINLLIKLHYGPFYINELIKRFPNYLKPIITYLIKNESEFALKKTVLNIFITLIQSNHGLSHNVLEALYEEQSPFLYFALVLKYIRDSNNLSVLLTVLTNILSVNTEGRCVGWIMSLLKREGQSLYAPFISSFNQCIYQSIHTYLYQNSPKEDNEESKIVICGILRLWCAWKMQLNHQWTLDEIACYHQYFVSHFGNFYPSYVSLMLYNPNLLKGEFLNSNSHLFPELYKKTLQTSIIDILTSSKYHVNDEDKNFILHLSLLLNTSNVDMHELSNLVSQKIGIRVHVKPTVLAKFKAFVDINIPQNDLMRQCFDSLDVIQNLNAHTNLHELTNLSILMALFKSAANEMIVFNEEHFALLKRWLVKQIKNCSVPINSLIIHIIQGYIHQILTFVKKFGLGTKSQNFYRVKTILDDILIGANEIDQIFGIFAETTENYTPYILFVYYVLWLEDAFIEPNSSFYMPEMAIERNLVGLIHKLPINNLLRTMLFTDQDNYTPILPNFLGLIIKNHAYTFSVEEWMANSSSMNPNFIHNISDNSNIAFKFGFDNIGARSISQKVTSYIKTDTITDKNFNDLLAIINPILEFVDQVDFFQFCNVKLMNLLNGNKVGESINTPVSLPLLQTLQHSCLQHLNNKHTKFDSIQALTPITNVHDIKSSNIFSSTLKNENSDNLVNMYRKVAELSLDPLLSLKHSDNLMSDSKFLRSTIQASDYCLKLSAQFYTKYLLHRPDSTANTLVDYHKNPVDRTEAIYNLLYLQNLLQIQILIELCAMDCKVVPNDYSKLYLQLWKTEYRTIICSYLHQRFIDDPRLIKDVHTQGYDVSIIPILVSHVPSLHVIIDLVPELVLQETSVQIKLFGLYLVAYLSRYYTLPKFMDVASLCLTPLSALIKDPMKDSGLTTEQRAEFGVKCLAALNILCESFPDFLSDVYAIYESVGKLLYALSENNSLCDNSLLSYPHQTTTFTNKHGIYGATTLLSSKLDWFEMNETLNESFKQFITIYNCL